MYVLLNCERDVQINCFVDMTVNIACTRAERGMSVCWWCKVTCKENIRERIMYLCTCEGKNGLRYYQM